VKKTLFSLAFIAVSGTYVAAANHLLALPGTDDDSPTATDTALRVPPEQPAAAAASAMPLVASPAPPVAASVPLTAQAAPSSSFSSSAEPTPLAAQIAPIVLPPLPRPRPTPPRAALQSAASITAANNGGLQDGTYTGSSENAYYGRVQIQVTIASHRISAIKVLDYPKDRRTSRYINSQALPLLQQEVISASSANVDTISGATLTSQAYLRSLDRALSQAGGASA
jgi:uncharacterized protein with FMN-binding domain